MSAKPKAGCSRLFPGKRIIICCDGTWQDSDGGTFEVPTNVTRLARAIEPVASDGTPQIVYYQSGVGTNYGMVGRVISGTTGQGLSENVREAYTFLANNYATGDKVILEYYGSPGAFKQARVGMIGFSRGAYTARSICGLINRVGILTRRGMDQFFTVYNDYQQCKLDLKYAEDLATRENGALVHKNSSFITAILCFDTVGSLGIPSIGYLKWRDFNKQFEFHDTGINMGKVGFAFHALALDENRGPFTPSLWENPPPTESPLSIGQRPTNLRQCWFPGVHTNIGGGYDDQEIADITLAWAVEMLQTVANAVDFCESYLDKVIENEDAHSSGEWAEGKVYDSAIGIFKLVSGKYRTPGEYKRIIPGSDFGECIHPSVRVRMENMNRNKLKPKWVCKALEGWEYERDESAGGWKWYKKGKDGKVVAELMEEPLGMVEKKLAGRRVIEKYFGTEAWDVPDDEFANKCVTAPAEIVVAQGATNGVSAWETVGKNLSAPTNGVNGN
ncbi:hypothetical protein BDZ91DRAFT_759963 [Kalaharituber pfeilii]|nr:hypothetical protein BDZ91DRAFT_759963 [Kalaharituber pfeilii]